MEEAIISSEKVAVTFAVGSTPVALAVGTVLMTLGGTRGVGGRWGRHSRAGEPFGDPATRR